MQINIHNVKRFTYWGHLQRLFKAMNSGRGSVFKTQNMKISANWKYTETDYYLRFCKWRSDLLRSLKTKGCWFSETLILLEFFSSILLLFESS